MRDVSTKSNTLRTAKARATVIVSPETIEAIQNGKVPKADPLAVARVAGIQAAKNTSLLIPYCHQIPLDFVAVDFELLSAKIVVTTEVKAIWKTGVEMEALVAASSAALTIYDMLKIIDEQMEIREIILLEKKGGKSSMKENGNGVKAAVLVLSDSVSKGVKEDRSGKLLSEKLQELHFDIFGLRIIPDERAKIEEAMIELIDKEQVRLLITTGGTGAGPRDVTPEATLAVIDRRLEGIEETLRSYGQNRIPTAMLSRCIVGVRGRSLIINLPGSVGGALDGINAIFPAVLHVFRMLEGGGHS